MSEQPDKPDITEMALAYCIAEHGLKRVSVTIGTRVIRAVPQEHEVNKIWKEMSSLFGEYETTVAIIKAQEIVNMMMPPEESDEFD